MPSWLRVQALTLIVAIGPGAAGSAARAQERTTGSERATPAAAALPEKTIVNGSGVRTAILFIKPEGAYARKGEIVCELDASALKDQLENQAIGTEGAKAAYRNARLNREAAELAVKEYTEGIYKQDLMRSRGAVELARGELSRAQAALDQSRAQSRRRTVSREKLAAGEQEVAKARLSLQKAESSTRTLETLTMPKKLKQLELEVEKAGAVEMARIADYDRVQMRQDELRKQIDRCKISAPVSGRVSHRRPDGSGPRFRLEPGAMVRDGQFLLRIVPEEAPKGATR